jgi:surfeit locus 1 family protein
MTHETKRRIWPVLLASGIGVVILVTLGVWQVQRLQWKEALMAQIEQGLSAAPVDLAPGWDIIQALTTADGAGLLVLRGVAGETQALPVESSDQIQVTGILRSHAAGQGLFDPDNDMAGNRWYWWDVAAMYLASEGKAARHADLVLHLLPGSPGTEGLVVEPPKANLRNNHLGYAITWLGLAGALVVVTGVFMHQRTKKAGA